MGAYEVFKRYMVGRLEARQRGMSPRRMIDFAIVVSATGAVGMIAAALALRAAGLGLDLGARLAFIVLLLLAARPWLPPSKS